MANNPNKKLIEWLSTYNAEYNIHTQVLHIKKPMRVKDFIFLKIYLKAYRYKLKDITIEGR